MGRKAFDLSHRSGARIFNKETIKIRKIMCTVFRIATISYLDLHMFGLDPLELAMKAAVTTITQTKR